MVGVTIDNIEQSGTTITVDATVTAPTTAEEGTYEINGNVSSGDISDTPTASVSDYVSPRDSTVVEFDFEMDGAYGGNPPATFDTVLITVVAENEDDSSKVGQSQEEYEYEPPEETGSVDDVSLDCSGLPNELEPGEEFTVDVAVDYTGPEDFPDIRFGRRVGDVSIGEEVRTFVATDSGSGELEFDMFVPDDFSDGDSVDVEIEAISIE